MTLKVTYLGKMAELLALTVFVVKLPDGGAAPFHCIRLPGNRLNPFVCVRGESVLDRSTFPSNHFMNFAALFLRLTGAVRMRMQFDAETPFGVYRRDRVVSARVDRSRSL